MTVFTCIAAGGNWSNNATWGGAGHPVAGDTAQLSALTGGNTVTVDVTSACAVLDCTGSAGTLAFGNQNLTVTGGVTLAGTLSAGTGTLSLTGSQTLTSNGITFPGKLTINATNITETLVGNWVNTGLVTIGNIGPITVNSTTSETLTCNGGLTSSGTGSLSGTAKVIFGGGTITAALFIANNVDINCSTLTISNLFYKTGTLTYVAGTITTTGSTLSLSAACTLNTNGMTWNNVVLSVNATTTITLTSALTCSGTFGTTSTGGSITMAGSFNISCANLSFFHTNSGLTQTFVVGTTITVTNSINVAGDPSGGTMTIKSGTPSSSAFLKYQGTPGNSRALGAIITDIDASGGNTVYDYFGTLLRTVNITNITSPGGGGTPVLQSGIIQGLGAI